MSPTRWVMFITAIGMGLSLLFHVFIPRFLGISETADALIASLKVVLIVDTIIREGAKFSLVPLFIHEDALKKRTEFLSFIYGILNFTLCVGLFLTLFVVFLAPWIAGFSISNSAAHAQKEMTLLLRFCAPLILFGSGSTILGAFLNSQRRFKTVAVRNAFPPALGILVFLFLSDAENSVQYVVVAYTSGLLIYFGWLLIRTNQIGYTYRLSWISFDDLKSLKNTISLPTLGFAIRQITARILVEVVLVGRIANGAITLYNSAFKIFSAIQTLVGISIATTGLPDMAEDSVENNIQKLKQSLGRNIRSVLYIAIPVTLLLPLSASHISNLLFSSEKFTEDALHQISQVLIWLGIGTVFSCLIPVLNAGLYAQKAYSLIFRNMFTMAVLNLLIAYILVTVWQLNGIAITVSITAVLAVGNLVYLLRKTGVSFGG